MSTEAASENNLPIQKFSFNFILRVFPDAKFSICMLKNVPFLFHYTRTFSENQPPTHNTDENQLLEFLELDLIRGITQDGSSTNQDSLKDHQEVAVEEH